MPRRIDDDHALAVAEGVGRDRLGLVVDDRQDAFALGAEGRRVVDDAVGVAVTEDRPEPVVAGTDGPTHRLLAAELAEEPVEVAVVEERGTGQLVVDRHGGPLGCREDPATSLAAGRVVKRF